MCACYMRLVRFGMCIMLDMGLEYGEGGSYYGQGELCSGENGVFLFALGSVEGSGGAVEGIGFVFLICMDAISVRMLWALMGV